MPSVAIQLPKDVVDVATLDLGDCTSSAGHCYGSDGGTGVKVKVAQGNGGEVQAWTLSQDKSQVIDKYFYSRCQYCLKYAKGQSLQERQQADQ